MENYAYSVLLLLTSLFPPFFLVFPHLFYLFDPMDNAGDVRCNLDVLVDGGYLSQQSGTLILRYWAISL